MLCSELFSAFTLLLFLGSPDRHYVVGINSVFQVTTDGGAFIVEVMLRPSFFGRDRL